MTASEPTHSDALVLGVDCGTEGVRVLAVEPDGSVAASARFSHRTSFPRTGWAEQDPNEWWSGLQAAIRELLSQGITPGRIAAIGVAATSSTVVIADDRGEPLRPAMLWMDVRATREAEELEATGHAALAVCADGVSPEWGPAKVAWVKRNEPDLLASARNVYEGGDWLIHRMTGVVSANIPAAVTAWFYNARGGEWPRDLYAAVGCAELGALLPENVLPPGAVAGRLTTDAARQLGLPSGIPVVEGGIDSVSAMLALGVVECGPAALITGSSNVILAQQHYPVRANGIWGSYAGAALAELELIVGLHTAGSVLSWLTREMFAGVDPIELEREATGVPAGSDGLIVLPDFQGNRTPFTEPRARGAIWGLGLGHTRAHVYRATLEGIAYASRHALDAMQGAGVGVTELRACGGASRSDLAMQIYADVLGRSVVTDGVPDASALGAAISAAVGIGRFSDFGTASAAMRRPGTTFLPNEETHMAYDHHYELFRQSYPALLPLMRDMAGGRAGD